MKTFIKCLIFLVDEAGFEPATLGFGGQFLTFTCFYLYAL